ncbi:MAG: type II toxin-antitoxin system RelE/ParE family toxin [Verrucomicrobia subdivision 3 bacterium]|nr:type II toxin-antitoxin system RelE/ParE family toxin [Limisphaerales bacterium]
MSWTVVVRSEAGDDVAEAANWYDSRQEGLGDEFVEEVVRAFDSLAVNPYLNSRRLQRKDIRWRLPDRFPYRVIYERKHRHCRRCDSRRA